MKKTLFSSKQNELGFGFGMPPYTTDFHGAPIPTECFTDLGMPNFLMVVQF